MSVIEGADDADTNAEIMEFVEQLGGYFESSGLTRLAGRLLGWLLVCTPERQSSEELAAALGASSGGISTNARTLIQLGYIERLGFGSAAQMRRAIMVSGQFPQCSDADR